jgi:hypothetical protein
MSDATRKKLARAGVALDRALYLYDVALDSITDDETRQHVQDTLAALKLAYCASWKASRESEAVKLFVVK